LWRAGSDSRTDRVAATRGQPATTRDRDCGHRVDPAGVSGQRRADLLTGGRVPQPDRGVAAAGGERDAPICERDRADRGDAFRLPDNSVMAKLAGVRPDAHAVFAACNDEDLTAG